jgi:hypothetical protein
MAEPPPEGELCAVVTLRIYRDGERILWKADAVVKGGDPHAEDELIQQVLFHAAPSFSGELLS